MIRAEQQLQGKCGLKPTRSSNYKENAVSNQPEPATAMNIEATTGTGAATGDGWPADEMSWRTAASPRGKGGAQPGDNSPTGKPNRPTTTIPAREKEPPTPQGTRRRQPSDSSSTGKASWPTTAIPARNRRCATERQLTTSQAGSADHPHPRKEKEAPNRATAHHRAR